MNPTDVKVFSRVCHTVDAEQSQKCHVDQRPYRNTSHQYVFIAPENHINYPTKHRYIRQKLLIFLHSARGSCLTYI